MASGDNRVTAVFALGAAMYLKLYAIALPVFLALDLVWLGLVAKPFYRDRIGWMLRESPDWLPALLFYALFVAGVVFFVVAPALEKESWRHALLRGAWACSGAGPCHAPANMGRVRP